VTIKKQSLPNVPAVTVIYACQLLRGRVKQRLWSGLSLTAQPQSLQTLPPKFRAGQVLVASDPKTIYCGTIVCVERVGSFLGSWLYQCKLIKYPIKHPENSNRQDWLLMEEELSVP
jgi:hypothetical protein